MKDSAMYAKIVEWSDEDQCYVGSAPGLIFGNLLLLRKRLFFHELEHLHVGAVGHREQRGVGERANVANGELAQHVGLLRRALAEVDLAAFDELVGLGADRRLTGLRRSKATADVLSGFGQWCGLVADASHGCSLGWW